MTKGATITGTSQIAARPGGLRRLPTAKTGAFIVGLSLLAVSALLSWIQPEPGQFVPHPAFPQWSWWLMPIEENPENRPEVTTADLYGVCVIPGSQHRSLIAVGEGGTILRSSNGGTDWKPLRVGPSHYLRGVTFADANSGWAVGLGGAFLHTSDGGTSWETQASGLTERLNGLTFAGANSGWAVGVGGTILHTSNGGVKWATQTSGTDKDLIDVTFVDANSGWAVGYGGTVVHTSDGGANWKPQNSGTSEILSSVTFSDVNSGWAVGSGSTLLHTTDGGANWKPQDSGTGWNFYRVAFTDAHSGWAVGDRGTIVHTSDGGASWRTQGSGTSQPLVDVTFADANSGWAVGDHGAIVHTSDGGASWKPQASGARKNLVSLTFATPNSGWAVGWEGAILHSSDGGASWKRKDSGTSQLLYAVTFAGTNSGWAVGDRGMIVHTSDGGVNWTPQFSGTFKNLQNMTENLVSVMFADENAGWAVGGGGTILHTSDGGANWSLQYSHLTAENLVSVTFANAALGWAVGDMGSILHTANGGADWKTQVFGMATLVPLHGAASTGVNLAWAVGNDGTILHTSDGGVNWKAQPSGTKESLSLVTFVDASSGWAAGNGGTILHTSDGGANWKAQPSGTREILVGLTFVDANSGWALGSGGTVLHTSDGGSSWQRLQNPFPYRRWPAPWLHLAAFGVIPLLVWAASPTVTVNRTGIDELVSSDSPVTNLKDDRLGQRALVERLSRFLRNPNTSPPLVISLQARWGMGKSSVMRMLESSLKEDRAAVTVWFNAWHHQKEDQLLAYLLETIQKAMPPWLSAVGLSFRFDLLRVRLLSGIDRLAVMLLAIAFLTLRIAWPTLGLFTVEGWRQWLLGAGYVGAGWVIVQALVAFKSNPEKLTDQSGGFLVHTLKELVSLPSLVGRSDVRQEFADNLKDVVDALSPQRLVIFLDDLDRCKPDQVVQILEAINFLSSIAPCVIIVGADYEKVETLVAMQFEQIALREEENKGAADAAKRTVALRVAYARNYLKKIVNLRMNLRLPTVDGYRELLDDQPTRGPAITKTVQRAAVFAILALPVVLTPGVVQFMRQAPAVESQVDLRTSRVMGKNSPATEDAAQAKATPTSGTPQPTPAQPPARPSPDFSSNNDGRDYFAADRNNDDRTDGRVIRNWLTFGIPGSIFIAAMVYWRSRPRRLEEAQDAEGFAEALKARGGDISRKCGSPREVRRFLNYLRLVATASGTGEKDDIKSLRENYPGDVDRDLVDLAALGAMPASGDAGEAVRKYFEAQCDLIGLDPKTFSPTEGLSPDSNLGGQVSKAGLPVFEFEG